MPEVSIIEYSGIPIAEKGRYSGVLQTYQDVASWEVPTGKAGVLFQAYITTSVSAKTQVRLQFKKPLTGTLTFINGNASVTGSGTAFSSELEVGDKIILDADGTWAEVLSITSVLALTLTAAYTGTGGSGAGSKVWGFQDEYIPDELSLAWGGNKLAAGIEVKWQAKSTDGTAIVVDGSITGKTLEYE